MIRFKHRRNISAGSTTGLWDIHNHILPGIDDGSGSIEESINMVREEHAQGVRHIVFTPHFRPGMFTVGSKDRMQAFREVVNYAQSLYSDMTFQLGCEVHVHKNLLETIKDPACRMNGGLVVLLEYSIRGTYDNLEKTVLEMVTEGYQPIIAHAERYQCLYQNDAYASRLKNAGALIQINAGTFLDKRRSPLKHFAANLIDRGLVDFIASDAHDMKYRKVCIAECVQVIQTKYGADVANRIFRENPEKLFVQSIRTQIEKQKFL